MATNTAARRLASFVPYWWGDAQQDDGPSSFLPALNQDHVTDFLVIGGGYSGMSVARELKKKHPNMKVTICEAGFSGMGASGRNGGFLTSVVGHNFQHVINEFGEDGAKKASQLMRDAVEEVHHLITTHQIECNYSPHGTLYTAWTPRQQHDSIGNVEAGNKLGYAIQLMTKEELHKKIKGASENLAGGYYERSHCGNFNPYKLCRGLMEKTVIPLGVNVFENSRVTDFKWEGDDLVRCKVNGHEVVAKNVAICTNSYTAHGGLDMYHRSFVPLHSYQIVTEVLPKEALEALGWDTKDFAPSFYTMHRILYGIRLTYDQRLAIGTGLVRYYWNNELHVKDNPQVYQLLEQRLYDFFPVLKQTPLKIEYKWEGVLAATLDDLPRIGRDPKRKNVFYSFGYNGHGNAMANYCGKILVDLYDDYDAAMLKYKGIKWIGVPPEPAFPFPPEPLRMILTNGLIYTKHYGDRIEEKYNVNIETPLLGVAMLVTLWGGAKGVQSFLRRFRR